MVVHGFVPPRLAWLLITAVLVGCSGAQRLATAAPDASTGSPSAVSSGRVTAPPTTSPASTIPATASVAPATDAPATDAGTATLGKLHKIFFTDSIKYVHLQLIQEVTNASSGWVKLITSGSNCTIYAPDGSVTTCSFSKVAPLYLAPGKTGYLLGEQASDTLKESDVAKVEVTGKFKSVEPPAFELPTAKTKLGKSNIGRPTVTGTVTNDSKEEQTLVSVVVVLLSDTTPVGWGSGYIQSLAAGETVGFSADGFPIDLRGTPTVAAYGEPFDIGL